MSRCPNCSAELLSEYCCECGQRRIDPEALSARHFFADLADDIASYRAKFKTLHTLRGLLTPGLLTTEYLSGRRQPYLSPLKLYLVCAALFFLAAPVAGFRLASMLEADSSGTLRTLVTARAAERGLELPLFEARFDARAQSVFTIAFGTVAIVVALVLQLLFRQQHRPFGAHLIFALHYVAVTYLLTILIAAGRRFGVSSNATSIVGYTLLAPYLALALERVYAERVGMILLKAALVLLVTFALNTAANTAAIQITLALV